MLSVKTILNLESEALSHPEPSGDTLKAIAEKYNTTVNEVKNAYIRIGKGQEYLEDTFTSVEDKTE